MSALTLPSNPSSSEFSPVIFVLIFKNYSWFIVFCQFLLYSKVTQPHVYIHPFLNNSISEFFCRTETPNKWKMLMKHSSFRKENHQTPKHQLWKQCKLASTLILICSSIFHSQNYKTNSPVSLTAFKAFPCYDLPLPGKAIKLFFLLRPKLCL